MSCTNPKCCELEAKAHEELKDFCGSLVNGNDNCFFYVVDNISQLFQVDPVTTAATLIGPTGFAGVTDIAWDGSALYGIAGGNLIQINTATGAGTVVGPMSASGNALEAGPGGVLYLMGGNNFYSVNKVTGAATLIGAMGAGFFSYGDLAWDPASSTMYGSFTNGNLGRIDISTGVASNIGPFGFNPVWGLDFCGAVMYGITAGGDLITVNQSSGAGTLVGNTGINNVYGLAAVETRVDIPCEPAQLPQLEPIFTLAYGDRPGDNLESNDVQCICITACNPYTNVCFNDVRVLISQVYDEAGDPVDPRNFLLKPSSLICFGDLAPCDSKDEGCGCGSSSCASREFVIVTRDARPGKYTIAFEYCYEIAWSESNRTRFEIEVVRP